jgi:hypothetical protein
LEWRDLIEGGGEMRFREEEGGERREREREAGEREYTMGVERGVKRGRVQVRVQRSFG